MTMTIVEFLNARLDMREPSVQLTIELTERAYPADEFKVSYKWARLTEHRTSGGWGQSFEPGAPTPEEALADIAAKRAIIALHEPYDHEGIGVLCSCCAGGAGAGPDWPCETVRLLASVYAEHPDYDEAWKPQLVSGC